MKIRIGCTHEPWCPDSAGFVVLSLSGHLQRGRYCLRHARIYGDRRLTIKEAVRRLGREEFVRLTRVREPSRCVDG